MSIQPSPFNSTELHFLAQGIAKVINESRLHIKALTAGPPLDVNSTEVTLLEYYDKRIRLNSDLLKKIDNMQQELQKNYKTSIAHNLA